METFEGLSALIFNLQGRVVKADEAYLRWINEGEDPNWVCPPDLRNEFFGSSTPDHVIALKNQITALRFRRTGLPIFPREVLGVADKVSPVVISAAYLRIARDKHTILQLANEFLQLRLLSIQQNWEMKEEIQMPSLQELYCQIWQTEDELSVAQRAFTLLLPGTKLPHMPRLALSRKDNRKSATSDSGVTLTIVQKSDPAASSS